MYPTLYQSDYDHNVFKFTSPFILHNNMRPKIRQAQIDYVTIPQRQAQRVHCPYETCNHIWVYQGHKIHGWILCPVCKRAVKLSDYPKEVKT